MDTITPRRSSLTSRGSTRAWRRKRAAILARDGGVCRYCGGPANTVDHVVARARGGGDDARNLVAACGPCNREKGSRSPGVVEKSLTSDRGGHYVSGFLSPSAHSQAVRTSRAW